MASDESPSGLVQRRRGPHPSTLLVGLLAACASAPANRQPALYTGASFAGLNNPSNATGDEDNIAVAIGTRICVGELSLRPEAHFGDLSVQFTPAVTWDFAIAGRGDGAIDGNIGLGYSATTEQANNVLGNRPSAFARAGVEGYLVGGVIVGAALMVAPWGYDERDVALAGIAYAGLRF